MRAMKLSEVEHYVIELERFPSRLNRWGIPMAEVF